MFARILGEDNNQFLIIKVSNDEGVPAIVVTFQYKEGFAQTYSNFGSDEERDNFFTNMTLEYCETIKTNFIVHQNDTSFLTIADDVVLDEG